MIRRPPRSTQSRSSAASDVYKRRLLHALPADVARDRRVVGLPRDLVDLVDVDDSALGAADVEVGGLDQAQQDVLHVLAHVTGLREARRVSDREWDVEDLRQRLREVGLAAALSLIHISEPTRLGM